MTLFQASLEKSDPTIAAPTTGSIASPHGFAPQKVSKFIAEIAGCRKMNRPRTMSATSAPTLATVNTVWIAAPSRTPRMFTKVRNAIITTATSRWFERPSSMVPPGRFSEPSLRKTSGVTDGTSTARNFANATATAAMVPVWITVKRVQP